MIMDLDVLRKYEEDKLITCRAHENGELLIWNYTQRCQFDRIWDDVTMQCRGLITDVRGNIRARPFKKFFNFGEHEGSEELSLDGATITEKYDGSLGIMYHDGDKYALATRGSFYSDQALKGTEMLQDLLKEHGDSWIDDDITYLFEIIYADNRIVVQYDEEWLALLAGFVTENGEELPHEQLPLEKIRVKRWHNFNDFKDLYKVESDNSEGLVVRFADGLRLKVKWDEYVRLHRIVTGVTARSIWECLKNGDSLDEILERVPDEFYDWVQNVKKDLENKFNEKLSYGRDVYSDVKQIRQRKEQALYLQNNVDQTTMKIVFSLLDGKDPSDFIWKVLKPVYEKPFKKDIDG